MSIILSNEVDFQDPIFHFDSRIIQQLSDISKLRPSIVQEKVIPLILEGKDVLVHASTGSGKTLSYVLPICNELLPLTSQQPSLSSVILVPTRELCQQVSKVLEETLWNCRDLIHRVIGVGGVDEEVPLLSPPPHILVSTPSRLKVHLSKHTLSLSSLKILVLDEADLVLSYGYGDDIRYLLSQTPSSCQKVLLSATLSPELSQLKKIALRSPAVVTLKDNTPSSSASQSLTSQHFLPLSSANDKFLVLFSFLRLK